MDLFNQTCPYCQKELHSMSDVFCPHCGVIIKGKQADLDRDRIQQLYRLAQDHFENEDWTNGIYQLIDALRLQPHNNETRRRLKEARHQFRMARKYEWAEDHYFAGDYNEALEHLEEIAVESPNYRDAEGLIEHISQEKDQKKSKRKLRQQFRKLFDESVQLIFILLLLIFGVVFLAAIFILIGL